MKTIAYIVPYFGSFPNLFPLWLNNCRYNPTVDWFVFTDDKRVFNYPENVHVYYMSFEEMKQLVQGRFEYNIWLERPYKLCDFKIAYGDIFRDYLKGYDFWGFCDIDMIWGDIRHFLTDDILNRYDKIGHRGHSTLIKNSEFYNNIYKTGLRDGTTYRKIAISPDNCYSDELYFNRLFKELNIPSYDETIFANLSTLYPNFRLTHLSSSERTKNKRMIFTSNVGKLIRLSVVGKKIYRDEFMYIHFLKRRIIVQVPPETESFLIVPNEIIPYYEVQYKDILDYSRYNMITFLWERFRLNAHKITWKNFLPIVAKKLGAYYRLSFNKNRIYG